MKKTHHGHGDEWLFFDVSELPQLLQFPTEPCFSVSFFELLFLNKEYVFMAMVLVMVMKVIYFLTHCVNGIENKH